MRKTSPAQTAAVDVFNALGQLTTEYQSVSGAVDTSTTPSVQYAYTEMSGGQNNSRPVSMTYPNGRVLDYNYSTGLDDSISRLSSISDNSGVLEAYVYLGVGTVVERDHPQTGVNETFVSQNGSTGDGGDEITGLDRFGRIVEDAYINALTGQYTDDFTYTYMRDSNVLTENYSLNPALNQSFGYNGLNELTGYARANGESQGYGLDALGNMTSVTTNGSTQTRTANAQNEYTSVSGGATPTYDNNGNLTTDPTTGNTFSYDAWNRLVKVTGSDGTTLATYQYDAVGRRDVETKAGVSTTLYYNDKWQLIEERVNGQTTAQNVWSPIGSDKMVLRDTNLVNGVLTQRIYVQQDMAGNVTAALNAAGLVLARFAYTPFGQQQVFDANWNPLGSSPVDLPYGFQGLRTDFDLDIADDRERVYVVGLQREAQNDPIQFAAGTDNFYVFVHNNPTSLTDPYGLRWTFTDVVIGAATGIVGAVAVVAVAAAVVITAPVSVPALLVTAAVAGAAAGGVAAGALAKNETQAAFIGLGAGAAAGLVVAATPVASAAAGQAIIAGGRAALPAAGRAIGGGGRAVVRGGRAAVGTAVTYVTTQATQCRQQAQQLSNLIGRSYGKAGTVITNPRLTITDAGSYAIGRMVERGLSPAAAQAIVRYPSVVLQQTRGRFLFISPQGAVVLDSQGNIITAYSSAWFDAGALQILRDAGAL